MTRRPKSGSPDHGQTAVNSSVSISTTAGEPAYSYGNVSSTSALTVAGDRTSSETGSGLDIMPAAGGSAGTRSASTPAVSRAVVSLGASPGLGRTCVRHLASVERQAGAMIQ